MAQSIMDRVRRTVLGKINSYLDMHANTPDGFKQSIRELEVAQAELASAIDEGNGSITGYKRQISEAEGAIAVKGADINLLLGDDDPNNDSFAVELEVEVGRLEESITTWRQQLAEAEANVAELNKAAGQLKDKHGDMVCDLQQLTLTAASTKAKTKAADAVEAAMAAGDSAGSVDSIRTNLQSESDTASARFDRVVGGLSTESPERAAELARAKARIVERQRRISDGASSEVTSES